MFTRFASGIAFLLLILGCPSSAAVALDNVVFQANWLIQGENAYMIAGREKGFYRDEGIDLQVNRGFGSGDTVKKVVSGVATVGTADTGVVMLARLRENLPVKCISAEYTYWPQGFWVLESSGIATIKALAGKRIGITPGNSVYVYFPLVAKANGLDPAQVTFVNMEASALLPTLWAGKVDAIPGFATVYGLRDREAKAQGKPMRQLNFAENGFKVYGECEFVTEATIANHAALIQRYVRATQKSLRWSLDNPEETAHILSQAYPELDEADVLINHRAFMNFVFNATSAKVGLGGFDIDELQRTFDAVKAAQKLDATADVHDFIDTRFLPKS